MKRKRARAKPRKPPRDVPLLLDFLNSRHVAKDEDSWTDSASLGRWLEERDLVAKPETLGDADLELAREARRLLRSLLLANSGAELDEETVAALDRLARSCASPVRFGEGGVARLENRALDLEGALGRLFAVVLLAQADGEGWARLKICASPSCRRAYFDGSTRRPNPCCSARCSNNLSARRYRRRYKARHGHTPRGGRWL